MPAVAGEDDSVRALFRRAEEVGRVHQHGQRVLLVTVGEWRAAVERGAHDGARHGLGHAPRPLHVAGFIWPTTESLLRGTSYVIDEPTGRGHVVLFAEDPNFRAIWRSTTRLFFNSFLFQPIF